MATQLSILAWKIQWTEEPGGLQSMGRKESDVTEHAHTHTGLYIFSAHNLISIFLRVYF